MAETKQMLLGGFLVLRIRPLRENPGTTRTRVPGSAAEAVVIAKSGQGLRRETIRQTPFFTLLRLDRGAPRTTPRVLVVEPLSGIRAPLLYDMLNNLAASSDVYALIWNDPTTISVDAGQFGLDENIDAILYAMQALGENLHVIGLCQSVLPVLAAAALLSAGGGKTLPASIVLLGGKLDTRIRPTRTDLLARQFSLDWCSRCLITPVPDFLGGAGRLVYAAEMQAANLYAYVSRHMLTGGEIFRKTFFDDGDDPLARPFLSLLFPAAIPAEFFLDTLRTNFHDSAFASGRLRWHGLAVEAAAIEKIALLTIEAEMDDIAAPGQTEIAHRLCRFLPAALRLHVVEPAIGHFGLFHGQTWRRRILPRLLGFFARAERCESGLDDAILDADQGGILQLNEKSAA